MRRALASLVALVALATGCGHPGRSFQAESALAERPDPRAVSQPAVAFAVPKEAPRLAGPARRGAAPVVPIVRKLPNGIDVTIVRRRDFPAATVLFVLDRGAAAASPSVASLYAYSLTGDSAEFESREAHEYLQFVGATTQTMAWEDAIVLRVSALSPLLVSALSRATPMFVSPKLTGDELDRVRAHFADDGDPSAEQVSERVLHRGLFGAQHPYAIPVSLVRAADVAAVKRDAVTSFRDMYLTAEHVHVVAVGDVDPDVLVRVLSRATASLPQKPGSTPPKVGPPELACRSRITLVDRPGAKQSQIAIGWPGIAASDPLGAPLLVLSAATGGWLSSRLNLTIRKELGASYGVRMRVNRWSDGGMVEVVGAVDTPRTAVALSGIVSEIGRLRSEPLGDAELDIARTKAIIGAEPGTSNELAFRFANAASHGIGATEALAFWDKVAGVSADAVEAAAKSVLVDDKRCIVIVGDAAKVAADVGALGLARVEVVRDVH